MFIAKYSYCKYLVNILHVKNASTTSNTILQFFSITVYGHVFLYILGFFHCSFNSKNERNLNISTELLSLKRTRLLSLVENEHKKQTTSTAAQKKFDKFLHVEMKLSEATFTRIRFHAKTETSLFVFAFRPHANAYSAFSKVSVFTGNGDFRKRV